MAISLPGRLVLFDYGEVVSLPPVAADRAELVALLETTPEALAEVYDLRRSELDQGRLSIRDYWIDIGGRLGAALDAPTIQQLWAADFRSWVSVNPDVVAILEELAAGGTRMAMLSNAGFDFSGILRLAPIASWFEQVFVSAELDLLKPDPAIYEHVLRELDLRPDEVVFIDNKADNVEGAAALGIRAHLFTDAASLRTFLQSLT